MVVSYRRFGTVGDGTDTLYRNASKKRPYPKTAQKSGLAIFAVPPTKQLPITVVTLCQKRLDTPDITYNFYAADVIGSYFES